MTNPKLKPNSTKQPAEDYYDTFEGRGQDEQDQHDLANGLLPREKDLPPMAKPASTPPKAKKRLSR